MALHKITKGLNLPISGIPRQEIGEPKNVTQVAVIAEDYIGMKPRFMVEEGAEVKRGQALFSDRKSPRILFAAPAAGKIRAINRGDKRALQSVVVELSQGEKDGNPECQVFESFSKLKGLASDEVRPEDVRALLLESGFWTALRTRPFSQVPDPDSTPHSIFISAYDSHPLAPSMEALISGREDDFQRGIRALSSLSSGPTYLCKEQGSKIDAKGIAGVRVEEFAGLHPAGTPGLHIHYLDPVNRQKTVWYIGLQDVVALGYLLKTGVLDPHRVVSLAGPCVKNPRLLPTRLGAFLDELVEGECGPGENRIISGSVLAGRKASGEIHGYLGRYHQQISVVAEDREREFLGWLKPGLGQYSTAPIFLSRLLGNKKFPMTTSTQGSQRSMVPIGMYERVMPLDVMPTFLLRSLIVGDVERAEQLGCLELDEEDLGLCTFVCPGKHNYGPILRNMLTRIQKEG